MPPKTLTSLPTGTKITPPVNTSPATLATLPKGTQVAPPASAQPDEKPSTLLDNPVTRAIQTIFPGQKVGQAIGTLAGYILSPNKAQYDVSAPSPLQVAGDIGQAALTVAAPEIGSGSSIAGRIGANVALGAGLGATKAVADAKSIGEVAKSAGKGALAAGALSGGAEAVGTLVNNLPSWLTKAAFPKLKPQNVGYALEHTNLGSTEQLLKNSEASLQNYEGQIQSVLSHPQFKSVAEDPAPILSDALSIFPNSEYTTADLIKNAKDIAPKVGGLITKMEAGQADIQELNTIRKELDQATKSVYTSVNRPPETKALGAALSNAIREHVQTYAPATKSIFADYSKEIDLQKALSLASKKNGGTVSFKDVVAGGTGFAHAGLKGALEAILLERGLASPAVKLAGAKLVEQVGKVAPVANAIVQGTKAPLVNEATQ